MHRLTDFAEIGNFEIGNFICQKAVMYGLSPLAGVIQRQ